MAEKAATAGKKFRKKKKFRNYIFTQANHKIVISSLFIY